jgi:outer membrane protein assembly factor BamB
MLTPCGTIFLKGRAKQLLVVAAAALLACGVFYFRRPGPTPSPPAPATLLAPDPNDIDFDPPGPPPEVRIDYDANAVVRSGPVRWSTHLDGYLGRGRDPHLLQDADRVYVTHGDGVTALDGGTGKVLWHSAGPGDRMLLSGDLLLATDCRMADRLGGRGRWLTARAVTTGVAVFRVGLPLEGFDALPIEEVAGLFLVQEWGNASGEGAAVLFDRQGKVYHRFDRQVVAGRPLGKDRVFLTSRDVVRVSPDGKVVWAVPFPYPEWIAGGGFLEFPDGDLLAFLYCQIADSGVQVVRLDPAGGKQVWRASCRGLGVSHSKYEQRAEAEIDGELVKVTSRGSYGTFVELLDLASGRQLGCGQRLRH